jgi:membrane protease YdiL (CAAX protease family)
MSLPPLVPTPIADSQIVPPDFASFEPPPVEPPPIEKPTPGLFDVVILLGLLAGAAVIILVLGGVAVASWMHLHGVAKAAMTMTQKLAFGIPLQIAWYALAGIAAILVFRERWQKTFSAGIHWNSKSALASFWLLVPLGVLLSIAVAVASLKIKVPHDAPILGLFTNAALAWLATVYGILIAPAVEEIFFRGFLLPSIGGYTGSIVAAAITSALFALMHAEQTGFAWGAVAMLFCVSLALCAIRLRFRSVAASTLVHMCYNSTLFISLIHATGGYRHFDAIK